MNPQPRQDDGIIFLEADAGPCTPRPKDDAEFRKHLEMLRKHHPAEYDWVVKQPAVRKRLNDGLADPPQCA